MGKRCGVTCVSQNVLVVRRLKIASYFRPVFFHNNHFHRAISEDYSQVFVVFFSWLFFFAKLVLVLVVTIGYP